MLEQLCWEKLDFHGTSWARVRLSWENEALESFEC